MAKANVLDMLYSKQRSPLEFNFDNLVAPPLLSLLTPQDIYQLNSIARSVKLSGKIEEKYKLIDSIMTSRGFVKLHAGTNRVVYRFLEDQRFVIKIAVDKVGLGDNPAEFRNQFLLKPFVTKVFEVSPCGTVAVVERVDAIMSREEFLSIADDVFDLLAKFFIGKYVMEDIGCHFFMNWGTRTGFGPVLLDFPYVYELDGNKLFCNAHPPGRKDIRCGGELDYDDGFNNLICTKCGRHYHARDLEKKSKDQLIIVGGKKTMKVKVMVGKEVIVDSSKKQVAKVIEPFISTNPVMDNTPKVTANPVVDNKPKVTVNVPKDSIFNRVVDEVEEFSDKVDAMVSEINVSDVLGTSIENEVDTVDDISTVIDDTMSDEDKEVLDTDSFVEKEDEDMDKEEKFNEEDQNLNDDYSEEEYEDEEDDEYDEPEDYEHYLSNRDRKYNRQMEKQNRRTDFGEF